MIITLGHVDLVRVIDLITLIICNSMRNNVVQVKSIHFTLDHKLCTQLVMMMAPTKCHSLQVNSKSNFILFANPKVEYHDSFPSKYFSVSLISFSLMSPSETLAFQKQLILYLSFQYH